MSAGPASSGGRGGGAAGAGGTPVSRRGKRLVAVESAIRSGLRARASCRVRAPKELHARGQERWSAAVEELGGKLPQSAAVKRAGTPHRAGALVRGSRSG